MRVIKLNLMKALAYRGNFVLGFFLTALESATVFAGITVVFTKITTLAGWSYGDVLILNGVYLMVNTASWLLFRGGVNDFDRVINRGDFDFYLIRPISAQFYASIQRIDVEDVARSVVGIAILIYGLTLGHTTISFMDLPLFVITFFCGQAVLYAVFLSLKTISFKAIQGWATNNIAFRFQELASFPTDIYRGFLKTVYTFVIPLVFVATVPTKALLGRLSWELAAGSIVVAVVSLLVARFFWKLGIRNYSSASS